MPPTTPKRLAQPNDLAESERVPIRQCVGCRTRREKRHLLRFVRVADGRWSADPEARSDGRGAYLCSPQCVERVKKNKKYKGLATADIPPTAWPDTMKGNE